MKAKIIDIGIYDGYYEFKDELIGLTGTTGKDINAGGWYTGFFTLDEESLCRLPRELQEYYYFYRVRLLELK